jgi:hypothetical protein
MSTKPTYYELVKLNMKLSFKIKELEFKICGLELDLEPDLEPVSGSIKYIRCDQYADYTRRVIKSVKFRIDRYDGKCHTISFETPVTDDHAITSAEEYLNSIEYDEDGPPALFLENIELSNDGHAVFSTGS